MNMEHWWSETDRESLSTGTKTGHLFAHQNCPPDSLSTKSLRLPHCPPKLATCLIVHQNCPPSSVSTKTGHLLQCPPKLSTCLFAHQNCPPAPCSPKTATCLFVHRTEDRAQYEFLQQTQFSVLYCTVHKWTLSNSDTNQKLTQWLTNVLHAVRKERVLNSLLWKMKHENDNKDCGDNSNSNNAIVEVAR